MDVTYHQTIGREELAASIMKLPDGRHAARIISTTDETGEYSDHSDRLFRAIPIADSDHSDHSSERSDGLQSPDRRIVTGSHPITAGPFAAIGPDSSENDFTGSP